MSCVNVQSPIHNHDFQDLWFKLCFAEGGGGGLSWCTILLFAVVLLKPNCFWTIIHCKFPHGGGEGVILLSVFYHCIYPYLCCCDDFNPNLYCFSPISPNLCHCFTANTASNKKIFYQYCFARVDFKSLWHVLKLILLIKLNIHFQWVFWPVCNMPSVCRWSTTLSSNKNLLQTIQHQMEVSPPAAADLYPPGELSLLSPSIPWSDEIWVLSYWQ